MQSDVQHKATRGIRQFSLQEGVSRLKALNLKTHRADETLERRTYGWIIIDNKDNRSAGHEGLSAPTGSVKENTAPWGELGVARSRPPWPSISDRLIDKPIPIPFAFVVKKGVKTRSPSNPSPVPESRTSISTSPDSSIRDCTQSKRGRSVTVLMASMPFMIKFSRTCCN